MPSQSPSQSSNKYAIGLLVSLSVLSWGCEKRQKEIIPQNMTKRFLQESVGTYRNQGQFKLEINSNRVITLESYFYTPTEITKENPDGVIPCKTITRANIQDVFKIPKNRGDQNYSRFLNQYIPADSRVDYVIKFTSDPVVTSQVNTSTTTDPAASLDKNENQCKETAKSYNSILRSSDKYLAVVGEFGGNIELLDIYYYGTLSAEEKNKNDNRFRKAGLRLFIKEKQNNLGLNEEIGIKELIPDYQESHLVYDIATDPYDKSGDNTLTFEIDPTWTALNIRNKPSSSLKTSMNEECGFSFQSSIKNVSIPFQGPDLALFGQLQRQIFSLDRYFDGGTVYRLELGTRQFDPRSPFNYEQNDNLDRCKNSRRFFDISKSPHSINVFFMLGQSPYANSLIILNSQTNEILGSFYLKKP